MTNNFQTTTVQDSARGEATKRSAEESVSSGRARQGGLPARWARNRRLAALTTFFLVACAVWFLRDIGRADALDTWWLRARFSLREKLQPAMPDPEIVLVTLDEKSVDKWPEPVVAWGGHLADAINRVQKGGARLVALDWMQPEPTSEWFNQKFAKNDERLGEALHKMRDVVLVKAHREDARGRQTWMTTAPEILFYLPDAAIDGPEKYLGYAELDRKDSIVAAVTPGTTSDESNRKLELSFPARIVQRAFKGETQFANRHWNVGRKINVPLRDDNSFLVNYRSGSGRDAFLQYSLSEIAQPTTQPDMRFKNKIVLFGATWRGFNDEHYIPFLSGITKARQIPGVEINAHVVRTMLDGNPIREPSSPALWLLSMALASAALLAFALLRWGKAALVCVAAALLWIASGFALFNLANFALPISLPSLALLLTGALMGGYRALGEERERAQVLKVWGRFQDPRLVDHLLSNPELRSGEGRECDVTVLFADLKNFTKTVESLTPVDALHQLNRYLSLMTEVIRDEYGGVIDKYLGDGLMAQWGAPQLWQLHSEHESDHAICAVRACLELERRIRELSAATLGGAGDVTFGLRLSLHTGPVVAGSVGHEQRMEFTIIGDTVNVTSRLQETAKEMNCEFLISESTYERVRDWVQTGKEEEVEIRGRKQPLRVYEVVSAQGGPSCSEA